MFLLMDMFWTYALIMLAAAVVPGLFLLKYVWSLDTVEKEDPVLLGSLFRGGILAALCSIVLELVGTLVTRGALHLSEDSPAYALVTAFFVVAVVEEGTKFHFLKKRSWNSVNFNYRFDGIVYACFTSMGFALFENVKYVFEAGPIYGIDVALQRAVCAVPGHLGFSVFMGVFYGLAKHYDVTGRKGRQHVCLFFAWFVAVLLHGFYDFCLMKGTGLTTALFVLFVIAMYIIVIVLLKQSSKHDKPVWA